MIGTMLTERFARLGNGSVGSNDSIRLEVVGKRLNRIVFEHMQYATLAACPAFEF